MLTRPSFVLLSLHPSLRYQASHIRDYSLSISADYRVRLGGIKDPFFSVGAAIHFYALVDIASVHNILALLIVDWRGQDVGSFCNVSDVESL